jgi:hypothetical protein
VKVPRDTIYTKDIVIALGETDYAVARELEK